MNKIYWNLETIDTDPSFILFFVSFFFFFLMWTIFKVYIRFVTILFLFYVLGFWLWGCGILRPWPRIEPALPALEGQVLLCFIKCRFVVLTYLFSSVQLLSRVWLFATPWTAACQSQTRLFVTWYSSNSCYIYRTLQSFPLHYELITYRAWLKESRKALSLVLLEGSKEGLTPLHHLVVEYTDRQTDWLGKVTQLVGGWAWMRIMSPDSWAGFFTLHHISFHLSPPLCILIFPEGPSHPHLVLSQGPPDSGLPHQLFKSFKSKSPIPCPIPRGPTRAKGWI